MENEKKLLKKIQDLVERVEKAAERAEIAETICASYEAIISANLKQQ